jgi:iron complex outermembrane recepter protein
MRIAVVAAVCMSMVGLAAAADAEAAMKLPTHIPAQGLGPALKALAKDRGFQVVFRTEVVGSARTHGASGDLTTPEALAKLLEGTDLAYSYLDEKTVTILPRAEAESGVAAAPSDTSTGGSSQEVDNKEAQKSRSFRVAQVDSGATPRAAVLGNGSSSALQSSNVPVQLEEIVVTAQKRMERLIDTPQSVTNLSSDDLARLGAVQLRDFANTVPGLTLSTAGAGFNQISLRGVTTGVNLSSTVGIYVDDVPFGSSTAFAHGSMLGLDVGLFDIDRVEVLRGPQGTLYGASTMGGLIKYVTKQPDPTALSGEWQAGVSSTQHGGINYDIASAVNLPLTSTTAAVRLSGYQSHDGGYIDNVALDRLDVNRSNIYGGRIDFLLRPNEALTIRLVGFLQDISRQGQATTDYAFTGQPLYGVLDQHREFSEPFEQHFRLFSGTVTYDMGPATLTSISSYQTTRTENFYDLSFSYVPLLNDVLQLGPYSAVGDPAVDTTNKLTQELRLASATGQTLEWLIGGYYTHESSQDNQAFALLDAAGQPAPNDLFTTASPSRFKEFAGFADVTYRLTSRLDVTGGVRYAHNDQVYTQNGSGLFVGSLPTRTSSDGVFTYLANARYHFSDNSTAYVRYATGYRPGGPNAVANDPVTGRPDAPAAYKADRLQSYEAGFKTETDDHRLMVDIDGYSINWDDIQLFRTVNHFSFNGNAGRARIRGSELTLTAVPIRGLRLSGAFAYQNAKLVDAAPDLGGAAGERLPNVPRFTAAVTSDYEFSLTDFRPTVGTSVRYVTDRMASFDNSTADPQYSLPAYAIVDLRAGLTIHAVNAQLFVHNLCDRLGQLSANTGYGTAQVAIVQPRTYGIALSMAF